MNASCTASAASPESPSDRRANPYISPPWAAYACRTPTSPLSSPRTLTHGILAPRLSGSAPPPHSSARCARCPRSRGRTRSEGGLGLQLADLEDLRPAVRAGALDRRTAVLHRHLHGVLDLDLLALLDAVSGRHS